MNKIAITDEQLAFIKQGHSIIFDSDDAHDVYYHYPYWIKPLGYKLDNGLNACEAYAASELPGERTSKVADGLVDNKYTIRKTDMSEMDPNAWYFVLNCYDDTAAQIAALAYADVIERTKPVLAKQLRERIKDFNSEVFYSYNDSRESEMLLRRIDINLLVKQRQELSDIICGIENDKHDVHESLEGLINLCNTILDHFIDVFGYDEGEVLRGEDRQTKIHLEPGPGQYTDSTPYNVGDIVIRDGEDHIITHTL